MINSSRFPHIFSPQTTAKAVWRCVIALAPIVPWSALVFGPRTLVVWAASVITPVAMELVASAFSKKLTLGDGTAVLTGMLVACAMPPAVPPIVPAVVSSFSVLVVKLLFGGFGANWANPAMAGVAFAHLNWPEAMRSFTLPSIFTGLDGLSASSPFSFARSLGAENSGDIISRIHAAGYPISSFDTNLTAWLNETILSKLRIDLPSGYFDLLMGFRTGTIGDTAIMLILVGSLFLFASRTIRLEAPFSMISSFLLCAIIVSLVPGADTLRGATLFHLLSSGTILVAVFCTSDPVTTPSRSSGLILFGVLAGILNFLFVHWGSGVEGGAFAILISNALTPVLDEATLRWKQQHRRKLSA